VLRYTIQAVAKLLPEEPIEVMLEHLGEVSRFLVRDS